MEELRHLNGELVSKVRFAEKALAAQCVSENQLLSDALARETGRREEYEALALNMRQEHQHLVATLRAKLSG